MKPRSLAIPPPSRRLGTEVDLEDLEIEEGDILDATPVTVALPITPRVERRVSAADQRIHMRFDKVFAVTVGSEVYGDSPGVARNISAGGMLVEMAEPLPLGSVITIHFRAPRGIDESGDEIVARAEVKHHYCINYARVGEPCFARAVGIRFLDFDAGIGSVDALTRDRVLH